MLFRNDIFLDDGERHRLLHADSASGIAWAISLDDPKAWPVPRYWSELEVLMPMGAAEAPEGQAPASAALNATEAMKRTRNKALTILGGIQARVPDIFDPKLRSQLVGEREQQGHARSAIYKCLRRFWVGGQTPAALLGNFNRCGRSEKGVTAGRGAKSRFEHGTYQLEQTDCDAFADIIKRCYLKGELLSIADSFQRLLEDHYQSADGNGKPYVKPAGERPSLYQFDYYLRTHYTLEHRLRKRKGEKDFERDHRPVVGTVLARCQGVGHQYEADATIADVYLVAESDKRRIVGKPTIYFIIDRYSRLIVGWYIGFENSSWVCAMQALLTISRDKRAICERFDVPYDPSDWPAHEVFPGEVIADRELLQKSSDQIADELSTTVVNYASQRPDKKPVVECQFKLTRMRLQDGTPGFDPPENAKKRMGKHYERDASLTLDEFTAIIMYGIIEHNRKPMETYELSPSEVTDELIPSPIDIWNHNIVSRAGLLPRYAEEHVRLALLPKGEATVSEAGIEFGGCLYTCKEAIELGWFVTARKRKFKLDVSYDGRLVDAIYVHATDKHGRRGDVYACTLTQRSEKYSGLSFAEVKAYQKFRDMLTPAIAQGRIQTRADYHGAVDPINANALKKLKAAGPKKSRTSRRADIKDDRKAELRKERQEAAILPMLEHASTPDRATKPAAAGPSAVIAPVTGKVVSLQSKRATVANNAAAVSPAHSPAATTASDTSSTSTTLSIAEKARLMRERMRHG